MMANVHSPVGLRQRQRDRCIPRGRDRKALAVAINNVDEVHFEAKPPIRPPTALNAAELGSTTQEVNATTYKTNPIYTGQNVHGRGKNSSEEVKVNVTPEIVSGGREGRHFAVANVGNNGKIYLR